MQRIVLATVIRVTLRFGLSLTHIDLLPFGFADNRAHYLSDFLERDNRT